MPLRGSVYWLKQIWLYFVFQPRDVMKDTFKTMLCAASILWIVLALLLASSARTTAEVTDKSQPSDVGMLIRDFICGLVVILLVVLVITALLLEPFGCTEQYVFCLSHTS